MRDNTSQPKESNRQSLNKQKQKTGKEGENIAATYLEQKGYKVVTRNFRCQYGEIDLICTNGEDLIFVEVRSAWKPFTGDPSSTITWPKQLRLAKTALHYLLKQEQEGSPSSGGMRFDVVAIDHGRRRLRHIVSAFTLDEAFPQDMR